MATTYQTTEKTHCADGSLTASEMERRENDWRDAQPIVTRCAFCDWTYDGPAGDGRDQAAEHRTAEHPEAKRLTKAQRAAADRKRGEEQAAKLHAQRSSRALLDQMDAGEPVTAANGSAHENSAGDEPGGSTSGTPAPETSGDTAAAASPAPAEPKTKRGGPRTYGANPEERAARVLTDLQALAEKHGRRPIVADDRGLYQRAINEHGSWANAMHAAGFERPVWGRGLKAGPADPAAPDPPAAPAISIDADTAPALHDLERAALDAELTYLVRAHYLRERIRQHGDAA